MREKNEYMKNARRIVERVGLLVLMCICCLVRSPEQVKAYEAEDRWTYLCVADTYMIKDGYLWTTTVYGKTGTAVFDEKTNTLTLTNFTTEGRVIDGIGFQYMGDFKIVIKGENTLNVVATGLSMASANGYPDKTTITGGGR